MSKIIFIFPIIMMIIIMILFFMIWNVYFLSDDPIENKLNFFKYIFADHQNIPVGIICAVWSLIFLHRSIPDKIWLFHNKKHNLNIFNLSKIYDNDTISVIINLNNTDRIKYEKNMSKYRMILITCISIMLTISVLP